MYHARGDELRLKIVSMWQCKMGVWGSKIHSNYSLGQYASVIFTNSEYHLKKQVTLTIIHNVAA